MSEAGDPQGCGRDSRVALIAAAFFPRSITGARGTPNSTATSMRGGCDPATPWHFSTLRPLPQGQDSFLPARLSWSRKGRS